MLRMYHFIFYKILVPVLLMHILPFLLMQILNLPPHGKPIQTFDSLLRKHERW